MYEGVCVASPRPIFRARYLHGWDIVSMMPKRSALALETYRRELFCSNIVSFGVGILWGDTLKPCEKKSEEKKRTCVFLFLFFFRIFFFLFFFRTKIPTRYLRMYHSLFFMSVFSSLFFFCLPWAAPVCFVSSAPRSSLKHS